jgi:predicted metalloprotease with PDZ domain
MRSFRAATILAFSLLTTALSQNLGAANNRLGYELRYELASRSVVHVAVKFAAPEEAPLTLIMPRSVPGGYAQRPYDPFVINVRASSEVGEPVAVRREELGPRWTLGKRGDRLSHVEYDVDVARMEREILAASDSSKIREGYVSLLGYSIFAFIEGQENRPIDLQVAAPASWPVFSTLEPRAEEWADVTSQSPVVAERSAVLLQHAADYYALADSQIMMGPKFLVRVVNGNIPLFVAAYSEGEDDLVEDGRLAREALDKIIAYFGNAPFPSYTVVLEFLHPISARHEYSFSMEHLNSGTFYLDTRHTLSKDSTEVEKESHRFNYAHHIAHSWIPKRAYGTGYFPFTWEMTPVIDTIWFNEGFGRYVAIVALADALPKDEAARYRLQKLDLLQSIIAAAPPFIRRMPLDELSREGSFIYSEDFRVGQNLFARGALMAAEMDDTIRAQTGDQKSLRDALRYLIAWTDQNRRAFRTEELPGIFRDATGVDTTSILHRWIKPPVRWRAERW